MPCATGAKIRAKFRMAWSNCGAVVPMAFGIMLLGGAPAGERNCTAYDHPEGRVPDGKGPQRDGQRLTGRVEASVF